MSCARQRPASASTMLSRCARNAGSAALTTANTAASAEPDRRRPTTADSGRRRRSRDRSTARSRPRCRSERRGHAAEHQRLGEHEAHDGRIAEAVGLQDRELRNPLAHRLHHRVAGHEQQREHHGCDDGVDEKADVADLRDLRAQPILLALRLRLERRVGEQRVDLLGDLGRDRLESWIFTKYSVTVPLAAARASSK